MSHNTMTNWIEIADQRRFCQAVLSERSPQLGAGPQPSPDLGDFQPTVADRRRAGEPVHGAPPRPLTPRRFYRRAQIA
jgi:hypothetical protein